MVQSERSSSKDEALQVRGRPQQKIYNKNTDKSKNDRARSKSKARASSTGIVRKRMTSLRIVISCRIRIIRTLLLSNLRIPRVMVSFRLPLAIVLILVNVLLCLLAVFSGNDEWIIVWLFVSYMLSQRLVHFL